MTQARVIKLIMSCEKSSENSRSSVEPYTSILIGRYKPYA